MEKVKKEYVEQSSPQKLNEILINATNNFFPESGKWYSSCFERSKKCSRSNLPCNLRDNNWLAELLLKEANLSDEYYGSVLNFVVNSELFQEKRHEYELKIVKWQIQWIAGGGENWICDENYGGDIMFLTPVCDLGFRKAVIDTLSAIGMNKEVIEEGLEKYADIWRERFMNAAFRNQYEPIMYNFLCSLSDEKQNEIPPVDPKHKEAWMKMRLYEYYCNHKDSIESYGKVTPEMKMTKEEVKELETYLNEENKKRLELINKVTYEEKNNEVSYVDGDNQIDKNNKIKSFIHKVKSLFKNN